MAEKKTYSINADSYAPKILYRIYTTEVKEMDGKVEDNLIIACCLSSQLQFQIDGRNLEMKRGDIAIVDAGCGISCHAMEGCFLCIAYDGFEFEGEKKNHLFYDKVVLAPTRYRKEIEYCINTIIKLSEQKDIGWDVLTNVLSQGLLLWIVKELYPTEIEKDESFRVDTYDRKTIVKQMCDYFKKNYMRHISMSEIAKGAYLSTTYITRIFKECTGQAPIDYLISIRLEHACELLKDSGVSVQEAAKAVGYDDPYYFSKLFKKHVGMSPMQYKKESGKGDMV